MSADDDSELTAATWAGSIAGTSQIAASAAREANDPRPLVLPERYRQRALLGRGGMGEVWRVEDRWLRRTVAMKLIRLRLGSSEQVLERFREEAQITAQLEHPTIVPVYDVGALADGRLFYTMKEVSGRTLADALRAAPSLDARLGLVEVLRDICEGVGYAHQRGVLHRDLKPDNTLIGDFGETLVLDWGLSKIVGEPAIAGDPLSSDRAGTPEGQTRVGQVTGTRGFMAPEQRTGALDRIAPPTDVYALGAILYQLLTGQYPPDEPPVDALVGPEPLRALCRRALAHDPAARPPDASAFGAELSEWLTGHQRSQRARSWRDMAEALADEVPELTEIALRALDVSGQPRAFARRGVVEAGLGAAVERLLEAGFLAERGDGLLAVAEPEQLEAWPLLAAWRAADGDLRPVLIDSSQRWHAEGRPAHLLLLGERQATLARWLGEVSPTLTPTERDFAVACHEAESGAARRRRRVRAGAIAALLVVATALSVSLWQMLTARLAADRAEQTAEVAQEAERVMRDVARTRQLTAAAERSAARGRPLVASAYYRAAVTVADPESRPAIEAALAEIAAHGDRAWLLPGHEAAVDHLQISPDGRVLVTGGADGVVQLWDLNRGARMRSEHAHAGLVDHLAVSPDSRLAVSTGGDPWSRLWDLRAFEPRAKLPIEGARRTMRAAFSPDSARVVVSAMHHALGVWRTADGALIGQVPARLGGHEMAFDRAGGRYVTIEWHHGKIRFFDGRLTEPYATAALGHNPTGVQFSPDQRSVLVTGWGGAGIYDAADGAWLRALEGWDQRAAIVDAAFTPFGTVVARQASTVRVNAVSSGALLHTLTRPGLTFSELALTDGRRRALVGDNRGGVSLWDTDRWVERAAFASQCDAVSELRVAPDDRGVLVGCRAGETWHLEPAAIDQRPLWCDGRAADRVAVAEHAGVVLTQAPNAERACLVQTSGEARALDLLSGERAVAIGARGRRVLVQGRGWVRLIDGSTGREVSRHEWPASDGLRVVIDSAGGRLFLTAFDAAVANRNLSRVETYDLDGRRLGALSRDPTSAWRRLMSARGTLIDFTPDGKRARVVDPITGEPRFEPPSPDPRANTIRYADAPRAQRFAQYWTDVGIRVYDGAREATIATFPIAGGRVHRLAITADGTRLAAGDVDGRLSVWRVDDQALMLASEAPGRAFESMTFSPDGALLAVGTHDAVQVWSLAPVALRRVIPVPATVDASPAFAGPEHLVVGSGSAARVVEVGTPPPDPSRLSNLQVCASDLSLRPSLPYRRGGDAEPLSPWAPVEDCP